MVTQVRYLGLAALVVMAPHGVYGDNGNQEQIACVEKIAPEESLTLKCFFDAMKFPIDRTVNRALGLSFFEPSEACLELVYLATANSENLQATADFFGVTNFAEILGRGNVQAAISGAFATGGILIYRRFRERMEQTRTVLEQGIKASAAAAHENWQRKKFDPEFDGNQPKPPEPGETSSPGMDRLKNNGLKFDKAITDFEAARARDPNASIQFVTKPGDWEKAKTVNPRTDKVFNDAKETMKTQKSAIKVSKGLDKKKHPVIYVEDINIRFEHLTEEGQLANVEISERATNFSIEHWNSPIPDGQGDFVKISDGRGGFRPVTVGEVITDPSLAKANAGVRFSRMLVVAELNGFYKKEFRANFLAWAKENPTEFEGFLKEHGARVGAFTSSAARGGSVSKSAVAGREGFSARSVEKFAAAEPQAFERLAELPQAKAYAATKYAKLKGLLDLEEQGNLYLQKGDGPHLSEVFRKELEYTEISLEPFGRTMAESIRKLGDRKYRNAIRALADEKRGIKPRRWNRRMNWFFGLLSVAQFGSELIRSLDKGTNLRSLSFDEGIKHLNEIGILTGIDETCHYKVNIAGSWQKTSIPACGCNLQNQTIDLCSFFANQDPENMDLRGSKCSANDMTPFTSSSLPVLELIKSPETFNLVQQTCSDRSDQKVNLCIQLRSAKQQAVHFAREVVEDLPVNFRPDEASNTCSLEPQVGASGTAADVVADVVFHSTDTMKEYFTVRMNASTGEPLEFRTNHDTACSRPDARAIDLLFDHRGAISEMKVFDCQSGVYKFIPYDPEFAKMDRVPVECENVPITYCKMILASGKSGSGIPIRQRYFQTQLLMQSANHILKNKCQPKSGEAGG
ncbi:MAG: hypothetical protein C5B49_15070 [Bdellovibrio sp.]|nr:MAG: hypothetical protein C5B49_15070 [Bdellovibrio sp.]